MHLQGVFKYNFTPPWAFLWAFLLQPVLSLKSEPPPSSFKDHIKMNTSNSEFPNDTDTQDDLDVSIGEGFHEYCW